MRFDFDARVEARRLKALRESQVADEVYKKRCDQANSLNAAFLSFGKNTRFRGALVSTLDGARVTIRDGAKIIEVLVEKPGHYAVTKATGHFDRDQPGGNDPVHVTSDDELMDMLDAWTLEQ